jgi:hypothetical protein
MPVVVVVVLPKADKKQATTMFGTSAQVYYVIRLKPKNECSTFTFLWYRGGKCGVDLVGTLSES